MPFIPHTPESLLPRSDSKNSAATCRGLTSAGRPCRRAIGGSPQSLRSITGSLGIHGPETYCWQHKDQALLPARALSQGLQSMSIKERTSVDTLIDRLGLLEVNGQDVYRRRKKQPGVSQSEQKDRSHRSDQTRRPRPKQKQKSHLALFCCISVADDHERAPRPARSQDQSGTSVVPVPKSKPEMRDTHAHVKIPSNHISGSSDNLSATQSRPPITRDPSSRTAEFLSLIPRNATPQTTSLLLSELAKPVSISDEEGYIYMFWLTSESLASMPPSEAATSLLEAPTSSARPTTGRRRTSEILRTFSPPSAASSKILLKIGRASNVQRRLNEWTRQCGYNLSLIRYYPYQAPSLSSSDPSPIPRKVPYAHKVERLIHVELAGNRALGGGKCANCRREHREWFEVDASRDGVRAVDKVIRRWVDWSLRNGP
jgi:T5orf172 domain